MFCMHAKRIGIIDKYLLCFQLTFSISSSFSLLLYLPFFADSLTGLAPSEDIQQAKAEMFAEEVYRLENAFIRALLNTDLEQQV